VTYSKGWNRDIDPPYRPYISGGKSLQGDKRIPVDPVYDLVVSLIRTPGEGVDDAAMSVDPPLLEPR